MKSPFVPYGIYLDIINLLGQWKIVDVNSLKEMIGIDVEYFNLLKKIRRLETLGLVKSVKLGRKNKHIYLSDKGLIHTPYDVSHEITEVNITHDLIVATTLRSFLRMDNFTEGKMFHQIMGNDIYPDAEVISTKANENYRIALEIELTQKSRKRVIEKYSRYAKKTLYDYALFITNKESLYKAYVKFIEQMQPEIREAIIIIYDKQLSIKQISFETAKCFYLGKERSFEQIFRDEKG